MTTAVRFPLSHLQRWLVEATPSGRSSFNVVVVVAVPDGADVQRALDAVVARHEALRTTIADDEQVVHARMALTARPADDLHAELAAPFALRDAPLARAAVVGDRLALTLHHAIADGGSAAVLEDELARLLAGEDPDALPALPLQFGDYAAWERSLGTPEALAWWAQRLDPPAGRLALPGARAATAFRTTPRPLPPVPQDVARGLTALASRHRTTLPTVLGAAAVATLAPYATGDALVVGVTASSRHWPELRHVVGYLSDQVPVRVDLFGAPTFAQLLDRFAAAHADALAHQLPLGALAPLLARGREGPPRLDAIVNVLPAPRAGAGALAPPREAFTHAVETWWPGSALVDLQPHATAEGGPGGHLVANEAALDDGVPRALAAAFGATLARVHATT